MISDTTKKVGIIAAVVLVLGVGAFAAMSVTGNSSNEETEAEQTEEVEEEDTEDVQEDAGEEILEGAEEVEEASNEAEEADDVPEGYETCGTGVAYQVLRTWTWTDTDESISVTFMVQYFTVAQGSEETKWAYRITNAYRNTTTGAMMMEGLYETWTGEDFDWDGATSFTIETRGPSDTELEELGCSVVLESDIFGVTLYDNVESTIADILSTLQ